MKINKMTTAVAALAMLAMTGCNKDQFDQTKYQGSVDTQFMIDYADPDHDWCLTKSDTITINTSEEKIYSVQVLTANPYGTTKSEIAAEGVCYGNHATLAYTIPITQSTVYIAALDNEGSYLGATPFQYGTKQIDLLSSQLTKGSSLTSPTAQTFTYLYESTFPHPDDFDYNDMVLRISKSMPNPGNAYIVDLSVKLEACGAGELYAAAIQLAGIPYSAISKVEIVGGKAMDEGYPIDPMFITNKSTLQRGHNGNAVIRLFECAQYALARNTDEWGDIAVIRYNTSHEVAENYSAIVDPVTRTYRITFNSSEVARNFCFDHIDPFIIHEYNTGYWEVHTFPHRFEMLISNMETNLSAYDYPVSWSLVIPKSDFRYCRQGISLSSYNSTTGEVFGPYTDFTTWMQNHNNAQARKWYETLNVPSLVY